LGAALAEGGKFRAVKTSDDALQGFATVKSGDLRLLLVNRGAAEKTIVLPQEAGEKRFSHTLNAEPEARLPISTRLVQSVPLAGRECEIPPYSVVLIAVEGALGLGAGDGQMANLFPPRPHLTLWYPPYAATQPRFDPAGEYVVETSHFKDKEFAVITMDLLSLGLEKGGSYTLDVVGQSSVDSGVAVKLPDASKGKDQFVPLGTHQMPLRFDFTYEPLVNDGQLKLVITREAIERGAKFSFRQFRLSKWTQRDGVLPLRVK